MVPLLVEAAQGHHSKLYVDNSLSDKYVTLLICSFGFKVKEKRKQPTSIGGVVKSGKYKYKNTARLRVKV